MADNDEKVEVTTKTSTTGDAELDINDVQVPKNGTVRVTPGKHMLGWIITDGQPGSKYSVKLTRGSDELVNKEGTLDEDGDAAGRKSFNA